MGTSSDQIDALRNRLFPPPPARDGNIIRTQFVGSWEAQFSGTGRLTAFLTDYLLRFSAALDDIGLTVVYLQRHHLELGLKLLLERAGASKQAVDAGHDLSALLSVCDEVVGGGSQAQAWQGFSTRHRPLILLMAEVDPGSFAFRYPVNKAQQQVDRPALIDLRELEDAMSAFHVSVEGLVDALAREEGFEVSEEEEKEVLVRELEEAIRAIKASKTAITAMDEGLVSLRHEMMSSPSDRIDAKAAEALAGREEHFALAYALIPPLTRTLELIDPQINASAIEPEPPPTPPQRDQRWLPNELRQLLDGLIEWSAKLIGQSVGELGHALQVVYERSEGWSGIANQQLHEDLGRFLTRIHPALVEDAAKRAGKKSP